MSRPDKLSVKRANKARILNAIAQGGDIARIDIASEIGLSAATVTALTSELMQSNVIETSIDPEPASLARGRPREKLRLNPTAFIIAGAKISDDHITVAIMDFAGTLIGEHHHSHNNFSCTERALLLAVKTAVSDALDTAGFALSQLSALGVGVPGFIDAQNRVVHWSPAIADVPYDLGHALDALFECPVLIDNDANIAAIAERRFGFGKNAADFLVVTVEHGVGLGLYVKDKLFRGARGVGPEFGHTKVVMNGALCRCGQRGCLEAYVADYALTREAGSIDSLNKTSPIAIETLCAAAENGNAAAQQIFDRAGQMLGVGLANLCNLFDPSLVIFSGHRMQLNDLYSETVLHELEKNAINTDRPLPVIKYHTWGDLLWAKGAAAMATDHLIDLCAQS